MSLVVTGIDKRLGGKVVLAGASLACARGELVALTGENGAGKSTLLRIVAGELLPDAGRMTLDGTPLDTAHAAARRELGYVPEGACPLPLLTVAELAALVAALKGAPPAPESLVLRLGVGPFLCERMGSLSLGQRRRACLLLALVGAPWLLVLDEPTNGLDAEGVAMLAELLAEHAGAGGAALFATHDLDFADGLGARRLALAGGRVE
ncbi:MAG: ATP-binding cassette domain-containing protein [Myxococcales bacterium]|nr:ATP-binding cassette domain-containing protein [Myxococcales bacterium]